MSTVPNNINISTSAVITDVHAAPYLPPYAHYCIGSFLVLIGFLGFSENAAVLYVFAKSKQLRTATNMFIISLAISDFSMACLGNPLASTSSLSQRWLYGETGCKWEAFVVYFFGLASIYNLTCISFDRYVVIVKPLLGPKITKRIAGLAILIGWFLAFFWAVVPLLGWSRYGLEAAHTSCSVVWQSKEPVDISYTMTIFVFCFIVPVGAMVFSYYHVFMTIRNVSRTGVWDMSSRVARRNLRIEKKMAKTIVYMASAFLISWTPYAVVSLWAAIGNPDDISPLAGTLPAILAKSSIIWNPIIYVATNKQFRHAFYEVVPCAGLKEAMLEREQKMAKDPDSSDHEGNVGTNVGTNAVAPETANKPAGSKSSPKADEETFNRVETVVEELDDDTDEVRPTTLKVKAADRGNTIELEEVGEKS
uniref:Xenopsin n=1 Tax=Leptochiton asellus TaxID=211853 RepID=A0A288XNQ3_9MOLL|nr:xenopsin [Leptochiton asellus]